MLNLLPRDLLQHIGSRCASQDDVSSFLRASRATWNANSSPDVLVGRWLAHTLSDAQGQAHLVPHRLAALLSRIPCTPAAASQLIANIHPLQLWGFPCAHNGEYVSPSGSLERIHPTLIRAPCQPALSWLLSWAAQQGRLDVLSWALCIDTETVLTPREGSAVPVATFPAHYTFPEALLPLDNTSATSCNTSALHAELYRVHNEVVETLATAALTRAVECRQLLAARLLMEHSMANVAQSLSAFAELNDVSSLQLLLWPRPTTQSTQQPSDLRTLWQELLSGPEARLQCEGVQTPQAQGEGAQGAERVGLGVSIDLTEQGRRSALPRAAECNAFAAVDAMLDLGANPMLALPAASESGRTAMLGHLLQRCVAQGRDTRVVVSACLPPAAQSGNAETVALLLARGAEVAFGDHQAFMVACGAGHIEIVKQLIQAGSHPALAGQGWGLAVAATNGREEVVEHLLSLGVDPSVPQGRPLSGAAINGHENIVRQLLEAGADAHANDEEALSQAAHHGHLSTARTILEHHCREHLAQMQAYTASIPTATHTDTDTPAASAPPLPAAHTDADTAGPSGAGSVGSQQAGTSGTGTGTDTQPHGPVPGWPPSKLPKLQALMAKCPTCPNRTGPAQCGGGVGGVEEGAGAMLHPHCPSTAELWLAARDELAASARQSFCWYAIFCDGCGCVPVVGHRWRCRDCPRFFLPAHVQPPLQGFDLCDACQDMLSEGRVPLAMPAHPTHSHDHHTMVLDKFPKEWRDLDSHAHMLVWMNCYEALHPEVPPTLLHHLAVMHVNQDRNRLKVTTENLIALLAPRTGTHTGKRYWETLLPPRHRSSGGALSRRRTGEGAGSVTASPATPHTQCTPCPTQNTLHTAPCETVVSSNGAAGPSHAPVPEAEASEPAVCHNCGHAHTLEELTMGEVAQMLAEDPSAVHFTPTKASPRAEAGEAAVGASAGPSASVGVGVGSAGPVRGESMSLSDSLSVSESTSAMSLDAESGGWPRLPPPGFVLEEVLQQAHVGGVQGQEVEGAQEGEGFDQGAVNIDQ